MQHIISLLVVTLASISHLSTTAEAQLLFECNFDGNNACGMKIVTSGGSGWKVVDEVNPTSGQQGPNSGSAGSCYFLNSQVSASSIGLDDWMYSAAKLSKELPRGPVCVSFSQFLYGEAGCENELRLTVAYADGTGHYTPYTDMSSAWVTKKKTMYMIPNHDFQFDTYIKAGKECGVAIDDIKIHKGPC